MDLLRKNPIFCILVFVLLAAVFAGIWYLTLLRGQLSGLKSSFETKASQYDRYLAARPSPTRSNLEAISENYEELYDVYQQAMRNLKLNTYDESEFFGDTPVSRADWSFELHKFKENARYAALSNNIGLPSEVSFGFEDYGTGGAPPENGEEVHKQIVIVASLLDTLFDSGIDSFVTVQRGMKPKGKTAKSVSRRPVNSLYGKGDQFAVEPGQSIAVPGTIESYVFRLVFKGQSVALRGFLNRIANSSLPFVVRGVEVDLSSEGGAKDGLESLAGNPFSNESSTTATAVPIISDNTSTFVVTVEFLQLAVEVEEPASSENSEGSGNA